MINEVKPQQFWGDPATADWWVGEDERYRRAGENKISEDYIKTNVPLSAKRILEVGAGTGRLVGMFRRREKHSVDINSELCKKVMARYPSVIVHNNPAHRIDLNDNSVDLTFSFQCLQHIPNDLIKRTLEEMLRVTEGEVWLIEGWKADKEQGERTHKANGGSFVYYYDKILNCYEVEWLIPEKIRVYKVRKSDNPIVSEPKFGQK